MMFISVIGGRMSISGANIKRYRSFGSSLADGYWYVFGREWPAWLGGILIGFLNVALFAYSSPWYIYTGFVNWGTWLFKLAHIMPAAKPELPWFNTGSVQDFAVFVGAFVSILAANNFRLRIPGRKIRLLEGFLGGCIMGVGAILAPGCNIGGMFTAISGLSLSGFVLFFGLAFGAIAGAWLAKWRVRRDVASGTLAKIYERKPDKLKLDKPRSRWRQPLTAVAVVLVMMIPVELLITGGRTKVAVYLLFGLMFGVVLQRSGFCMTASFRDLFTSGTGRMARGTIVGVLTSMIGCAVLYAAGLRTPFVLPVGWHTVVGGFIFGFGMVLAGGCATGTLFRIGEGNVQYVMALLGAIIAAPLFSQFLTRVGFKFSPAISLVSKFGIQGALLIGLAFLAAWFLVVQWNEARSRR
jgi:uncharacterized protein